MLLSLRSFSVVEKREGIIVRDLLELSKYTSHHSLTLLIYYLNLLLVMGSYLLTISSSLSSLIYPHIILHPILTGFIAIILIGLSLKYRTMSKLGRLPTYVSIITITLVVLFCILGAQSSTSSPPINPLQIPSSLAGISFAVSSQKLLLNVRASMSIEAKSEINYSLSLALALYGFFYILTILSAPDDEPLLLNVLENGTVLKRFTSLLLSIHLSISFTINCQCFNSSLTSYTSLSYPKKAALTCFSVWLVANGVPFFDDLTSFIGGEKLLRAK